MSVSVAKVPALLLLTKEQRSSSFDETELSINKKRKEKVPPSSPLTKAIRSRSVEVTDLKTERISHILSLNPDDERLRGINHQLNKSRRIIVLTGAGISCNAGIPDFRSSDGLYNLVKNEHPNVNLGSGQEMFDISLFRDELKISVWATFMERLYSSVRMAQPTRTHRFIAHLKDRSKLLRCYTQNIDGLEENLGLEMSSSKEEEDNNGKKNSFTAMWKHLDVVQLHGDLNTLSCTKCFNVFGWSRFWARSLRRGELPECPKCADKRLKRFQAGKRAIDNTGILRPNIVLYGENHPSGELITKGLNLDILRGKPDFFIIMGTSLKVDGVKKVVKQVSKQVHERGGIVILINKTSVGDATWQGIIDYQIWADCDSWVESVEKDIPDFFKSQKQIDKLRQLRREASELRKKKSEEKKMKEAKTIKTPPTTPIREDSSQVSEEMSTKDEQAQFNTIKRKLIAPEVANKKVKTTSA